MPELISLCGTTPCPSLFWFSVWMFLISFCRIHPLSVLFPSFVGVNCVLVCSLTCVSLSLSFPPSLCQFVWFLPGVVHLLVCPLGSSFGFVVNVWFVLGFVFLVSFLDSLSPVLLSPAFFCWLLFHCPHLDLWDSSYVNKAHLWTCLPLCSHLCPRLLAIHYQYHHAEAPDVSQLRLRWGGNNSCLHSVPSQVKAYHP